MANTYHVSKTGNDRNDGSEKYPFGSIQRAADIAKAGDTVIVHEGVYREWVRPRNGGLSDNCRITYEAAEGEHVIIKGSEIVNDWERVEGTVWKTSIPNTFFNEFNPYDERVEGDWIVDPIDYPVHLGAVYINGIAMYEATSFQELCAPQIRRVSQLKTWNQREEAILNPQETIYQWWCRVEQEETIIYANFQEVDPKQALIEVNVRQCCFYPEATGRDYITVRGFEMAHAATPWAPPTANQPGLIGPNWSKGWVIEDNVIHDSKCCGISLGKEASTGDNDAKWARKSNHQYQLEAVFRAIHIGWSKETIGSHVVRRNSIFDCGQAGIAGHMGCAFSEVYENEIYNIGVKHEFYGHEIAGIKFHAAIDAVIRSNYIHNCSLGTWLDWQAQGVRVSSNLYDRNNRDLMVEVTHGPYLIDNNIFTSPYTFVNSAQGGAYVHNLCCGFMNQQAIMGRFTPYHYPHSTEIMGTINTYGFDDRWYQNIFVGGTEEGKDYGTAKYNGATTSLEEYKERVRAIAIGKYQSFGEVPQPVYIHGNAYFNGAVAYEKEKDNYVNQADPMASIVEDGQDVYLEIHLPEEFFGLETQIIDTDILGMPRIVQQCYEDKDGNKIEINTDMLGEKRGDRPIPGPIENVRVGGNRIKLWSRRGIKK